MRYINKKKLLLYMFIAALVSILTIPIKAEAGTLAAILNSADIYMKLQSAIHYADNEKRNVIYDTMVGKYGINKEQKANDMLKNIMDRLSLVVADYDATIQNKPYLYFVNNQENFNAFCTIGHNITVNIGLFKTLNYNEDEIAFVIAHELAHGKNNDSIDSIKKMIALETVTSVIAANSEDNMYSSLAENIANNIGKAKGITFPQEVVADQEAFKYCSKARYNIGAGAALWQRIIEFTKDKKAETNILNQIFNPSDHPSLVYRRDNYKNNIYEYSNKRVNVDADSAMIYINGRAVGIPVSADGMSSAERTYFVAGKLAEFYHDNIDADNNAYLLDGTVYLGTSQIINCQFGDDGNKWVKNINKANKAKKKNGELY